MSNAIAEEMESRAALAAALQIDDTRAPEVDGLRNELLAAGGTDVAIRDWCARALLDHGIISVERHPQPDVMAGILRGRAAGVVFA